MNAGEVPGYAGVVVEAPLTKVFHYRLPERMAGSIRPGDRVDVQFARRRVHGVVVSLASLPPIDPSLIKEILAVSPEEERIPADILELTRWVSSYYRCGWGTVLAAAVPAGVKQGRKKRQVSRIELTATPEETETRAERLQRRAPRQASALFALARWFRKRPDTPLPVDSPDIRDVAPGEILRQLAKKGRIRLIIPANGDPLPAMPKDGGMGEDGRPPVLTSEQEAALAEIGPR
ncbi:MAG: hypothetical protein LBE84_07590, partial [Planctomycetota bacterium]|nr:hypothetical protein [Planctomycetota bacterium]